MQIDRFSSSDHTRFRCPFLPAIAHLKMSTTVGMTYTVAAEPSVDIVYVTFQTLFDRLLAAIIALELARSVLLLVEGHQGLMQVRIILVIGLLAVVRKLILIELEAANPTVLFAFAAAVLALAASLVLIMYMDPKRDRQE